MLSPQLDITQMYLEDIEALTAQIDIMRTLCRYRHKPDIRNLAINNLTALTKERDKLCIKQNYYANTGMTLKK